MGRRCYSALLIAVAAVVLVPAAQACTCGDPGPPCRAFENIPVVFVGRVTQLSELRIPAGPPENPYFYTNYLVRFDVEESFRGEYRKLIDVTTGLGGGDCGFPFRMGERYLVYAGDFPRIGRLITGICTRTKALSDAAVDLDYLRHRGDPRLGAGIEGTIVELERDPKTNNTNTRGMMQGVPVVVESGGRKWEATTDNQGWFRFWGLPPGEYTVRGVLPRKFVPEAAITKLRITQASCGWVPGFLATPYPFPLRR
jgi:hypothetical protein